MQVDGDKGPKVTACSEINRKVPAAFSVPKTRLPAMQYLFNAPEGFARVALEHKLRPSKLRAAFVTQLHQQSLVLSQRTCLCPEAYNA